MHSRFRWAALVVATGVAAGACALNRPQVKGLRDRDAGRIAFDRPIQTSIDALNALPSACGLATNHRIRDEEFRVYEVVGRITRVKREHDHDIHIVLADPEHPRSRIVVESGDPDYHGNVRSPHRERIRQGRRDFDALVARSGVRKLGDLHGAIVRVTGVGFFDMNHLQIGRSRSCLELHPILSISLASSSAPPKSSSSAARSHASARLTSVHADAAGVGRARRCRRMLRVPVPGGAQGTYVKWRAVPVRVAAAAAGRPFAPMRADPLRV